MLETHQAVKSQRADIIVDQRHDSFLAPIYPCLAKRSEATGHCSTCQSNHLRNPANLQPRSGTCFELWCKDSLLSAKFVTLSHVSVVELHTYTYEVHAAAGRLNNIRHRCGCTDEVGGCLTPRSAESD